MGYIWRGRCIGSLINGKKGIEINENNTERTTKLATQKHKYKNTYNHKTGYNNNNTSNNDNIPKETRKIEKIEK